MNAIFKKIGWAIMLLFIATGLQAQSFDAAEIMKKNDQLPKPKDTYSEIILTLINKNGSKIQRELKSYSLKTALGYNSYFEVTAPADIAGMKLLSIAKKGEDDQRMYLPAFEKVRKISSSAKNGKFLGSDIYFYDLQDQSFDDFTYQAIEMKKIDGKDFYVIASFPKDDKAPYSKIINYVSAKDYFIYKSEMYDKRGRLLKILRVSKTQIIDHIIIPSEMTYENVISRHTTVYHLKTVKINSGISKDIFNIKNLEE